MIVLVYARDGKPLAEALDALVGADLRAPDDDVFTSRELYSYDYSVRLWCGTRQEILQGNKRDLQAFTTENKTSQAWQNECKRTVADEKIDSFIKVINKRGETLSGRSPCN